MKSHRVIIRTCLVLLLCACAAFAQGKKQTLSKGVGPLNRDFSMMYSPLDGALTIVWNESNLNQQEFGRIWAIDMIPDGNGEYEPAGPAFMVSPNSGSHQRPTIQYSSFNKQMVIAWDTGPRDPRFTEPRATKILGRLYSPRLNRGTAGLDDIFTIQDENSPDYSPQIDPNPAGDQTAAMPVRFYRAPGGTPGTPGPASGPGIHSLEMFLFPGEIFFSTTFIEVGDDPKTILNKSFVHVSKSLLWCAKEYFVVVCFDLVILPGDRGEFAYEYSVWCKDGKEIKVTPLESGKTPSFDIDDDKTGFAELKRLSSGQVKAVNRKGPKPCEKLTINTPLGRYEYDTGSNSAEKKMFPSKPNPGDNPDIVGSQYRQVIILEEKEKVPAVVDSISDDAYTVYHDQTNGRFYNAELNRNNFNLKNEDRIWKVKKFSMGRMEAVQINDTVAVVWVQYKKSGAKSKLMFRTFKQ